MSKQRKTGRPELPTEDKTDRRHVVNLSPRLEESVQKFRAANGIARLTDAIRQALTQAMRDRGFYE